MADERDDLVFEIERLSKINRALMSRVERTIASQGNAFSLLEGNIILESKVKARTTELRALNQELNFEKEKLARILAAVPGTIVIFNAEYHILNWYFGTDDSIGFSDGTTLQTLLGSDFFEKLKEHCAHVTTNLPIHFQFDATKNETPLHFMCSLTRIDSHTMALYLLNNTQFIEKERRLKEQEARIIQASKLSALGEMAGGIAHEINNPLAIIGTMAYVIRETLENNETIDNGDIVRKVKRIEETVERISKIVRGLRLISRDASEDPAETVDVRDIVADVLSTCQEKMKARGVRIDVDCQSYPIQGKRIQLAQVLLNLISNSFYVAKDHADGWIKIETKDLTSSLRIYVIDSGQGIEPQVLQKLFQPFFTTKPLGEGTGLGMSISKQIVRDHKGQLNYELRDGHTSFYIELPKHDAA